MKIIRAKEAGFCYGVKRAFEIANKSINESSKPIYSLGPIIHNRQAVEKLAETGVKIIDNITQAEEGSSIIIRSHGVGPDIYRLADLKNLTLIDATCPFVTKAQKIAEDIYLEGNQSVLVGDENHPEVIGIKNWTQGTLIVLKDFDEAQKRDLPPKIGVLAQTTQTKEVFESVVEVLKNKCENITVYNSICNATKQRQKSTVELAKNVDLMVVIGGSNSANTAKLTALSKEQGTTTYQIESADEINKEWLDGDMTVGITAGASTPQWIIEEVERRMKEMDEMFIKENDDEMVESEMQTIDSTNEPQVESENTADDSTEMNEDENMSGAIDIKSVRSGEVVSGIVVQVNQDEVLVDIGAKSEGVIPKKELSSFEVNSPSEIVNVGDKINVLVVKLEDEEGRLILSKTKADAGKTWEELEQKFAQSEAVHGVVKEVVNGGLLVDIGLRAFMPASLVDRNYIEDLSVLVNENITAKVIELDPDKNKIILSRKVILEEEYSRKRSELLNNLEENQVVKGTVKRLTNFGAFVDIGGIDGLLHVSEIAWHRINHPSDVLKINDEIEVVVLRVDKSTEKISLGLKQLLPSPWDRVEEKYPAGDIVQAKVVRLAPFGAFVQLEPGVEGLVHISHLSVEHVEKTEEIVEEGQQVKVKVLSVDPKEKRIRLSIREAEDTKVAARRDVAVDKQDAKNVEAEENPVTIGDLVGNIFQQDK